MAFSFALTLDRRWLVHVTADKHIVKSIPYTFACGKKKDTTLQTFDT